MRLPRYYLTKGFEVIRGTPWFKPAVFEIPVAYDQTVTVKLYWPSTIQFPPNTEIKHREEYALQTDER